MGFETCFDNPAALTEFYPDTSCFDDVIVKSLELVEGFANLDLDGVIPRAPDVHNGKRGANADHCRLLLNFMAVEAYELKRTVGRSRGWLRVEPAEGERKRFHYESPGLRFWGVCRHVIVSLSPDSEEKADQRRRTFRANQRMWNACLNRLRDAGWSTDISGRPDDHGTATEVTWNAVKNDISLFAGNPLALLGMVSLNDLGPAVKERANAWDAPSDDPALLKTIIEGWERRNALD